MNRPSTIYFIAGEASGDEHGAALMRALRDLAPEMSFSGRGGPKMKAIAGDALINWSDSAAVVGLWEVFKRYGYFREQFQRALNEIATVKPDAVVLIDYPGFNLCLARALRKKAPALKIIYYISPQVWAWHRGRIAQMARFLDLMLCIFPFEAELYNKSGLRTIFVGHPMIENLARLRTGEERQSTLIGLFPGSRLREVRKIFPIMLETVGEIAAQRAEICFEVAAASEPLALEIQRLLASASSLRDRVRIVTGDAAGTMQRAVAGMVASGTATLEAAYFRLPFVLVYKVSWPTYFAARLVLKTKHLGMPNVLAGREIVPEFIQHEARPDTISKAVLRLMDDQMERERMISEFDAIIAKLGETGASAIAARVIVDELNQKG
ncbi:MAG TPA: lipid-A-disaccharide synthase [Chthoniobacterales bacterium]|nr:lipid-A-disaccharide synthase [Chthoniobacterales bacterium]